MSYKEFLLELNSKKNALKYFPSLFEKDFNISINKTIKDLREKYLNYCEKYFTLESGNDYDKQMIQKLMNILRAC